MDTLSIEEAKVLIKGLYDLEEISRSNRDVKFKSIFLAKVFFAFGFYIEILNRRGKSLRDTHSKLSPFKRLNLMKPNPFEMKKGESDLSCLARHIRNSLFHARFRFIEEESVENISLEFEDICNNKTTFKWQLKIKDINALFKLYLEISANAA